MGLGDIIKKDCEAFLKKNGVKQCMNMKPVCSLLESFTNKTINNNSKCKVKKAKGVKPIVVKEGPMVVMQKPIEVDLPMFKQTVVKQMSVKKEPEVSLKEQMVVKEQLLSSYEEVTKSDMELIRKYIEVTFKKVGVEFKNCDDIEKYKEELRKKCIKFLGYDSPAKTPNCVQYRFRKFLKENSKMEGSLMKIGCKI